MVDATRNRALVALLVIWAAVMALALNGLTQPARGAIEGVLILGGALTLMAHTGFRACVSRASRVQRYVIGAVLVVWFFSQIRELKSATYPLMSWHMYGESLRDAPMEGYRLQGTGCDGKVRRVAWKGGALGRRPTMGFAIPLAFQNVSGSNDGPSGKQRTVDSLMMVVLNTWNEYPGNPRLCRLDLERVHVRAADALRSPLPAYETVRTVSRP